VSIEYVWYHHGIILLERYFLNFLSIEQTTSVVCGKIEEFKHCSVKYAWFDFDYQYSESFLCPQLRHSLKMFCMFAFPDGFNRHACNLVTHIHAQSTTLNSLLC